MERLFFVLSAAAGFTAVALGAFGAHGLKRHLAQASDLAQRMDWWETAAHYHLVHAVALGLIAYVAGRSPGGLTTAAGVSIVLGILLFSGSLYAMTLTGIRVLGAVTPLGGLCLLVGWVAFGLAAFKVFQ